MNKIELTSEEKHVLLIPPREWKCYEIKNRPGLIFINNPFTSSGQRFWISRCLRDYPKAPNVVNLNSKQFKQEVRDDWWQSYLKENDKDERKRLKVSMRWTTLGYHHDWDTKIYSEHFKNEFPNDLADLTKFVASTLGFKYYSAEAAIVNYYPIGSTLAGHTDHSEANLQAPLFSFSFGQKAIFLLGGQSKEEKPSAMFLKSGDVVVMSRDSRLCYHAVPRVMKCYLEPYNNFGSEEPSLKKRCKKVEDCDDEDVWKPFKQYLEDSRININVRQVLNKDQLELYF